MSVMNSKWMWIIACLLVSVGMASAQNVPNVGAAAGAQNAAQPGGAAKTDSPGVKVERGEGGKKVYRITTGFVIEGRIQKPNAFYVLQRSQINYDWVKLKQDFVPLIVDAVRQHPF